jgi:glutamyl-tRNA reductase
MGRLVMVGLSHTAAPLAVRERVAFEGPTWRECTPKGSASVLLSTCNRVEVYAWAEKRPLDVARSLQRSLASAAKIDLAELEPHLSTLSGRDALLHLVRVTSGLDSLVVGEEQIRGQVREALRAAEASGRLPPTLRGIFQRVGESARRVRGNSQLAKTPSIASAGVSVAVRGISSGIQGQLAVVLGAGVMARAAAEALARHGARIRVLNRTPAHAQRLIEQLGRSSTIESSSLEALAMALTEAALVVCATASRAPVVSHAAVKAAMPARGDRPLVMLDVALPRDVDPSVRDVPGATLIDLDDLERLCPLDPGVRHAEHAHAEALAAAEADRLADWLRLRAVSPAIAELRTYAEAVRRSELQRSAGRLRDLSPEQIAAVEALTSGIVNKLMHGPTVALRDAAAQRSGAGRTHSRLLRMLRPSPGRNGLTDHGV